MKKMLLANFKSNKTVLESKHWLNAVVEGLHTMPFERDAFPELILAPSFPSIGVLSEELQRGVQVPLSLAVQDISPFPAGSYTGAVGVANIAGLGITHAILGHSERRRYFGETSVVVAQKAELCIENGLQPVVCIDSDYLEEQLSALASMAESCLFAYEPLSAIGTGKNASVGQVTAVIDTIKKSLPNAQVLYGGSVTEFTVGEYTLVSDGALIGGASLDPAQFLAIVAAAVPLSK